MPMSFVILIAALLIGSVSSELIQESDNYKYYCTGNCKVSVEVQTFPGLVLMGGGLDVDNAFIWMINRSKGGDFLVIRTDDDPTYDPYIYAFGGLNSAATLVLFNRSASYLPFVVNTISAADALWMAGGDQWTYYSFWKDSPVEVVLNELINFKGVPVGGTSAGMESLGQFVSTAEFSTTEELTSKEALNNPYYPLVTIGDDFLNANYMQNVITDAHFEQRDRMGRLVTFLARLLEDVWASVARGIACDQGTALLVEPGGMTSVTSWWTNGSAYFLNSTQFPQVCAPNTPLTFYEVSVFRVSGNASNVFDLSTWTGISGTHYSLAAMDGVLKSTQPNGNIY